MSQSATLSQAATIQSLSFYVTTAAGKMRMGIYDATGPSGGPGALKASTGEVTPVSGWNTASVTAPISLAPGKYWLAVLPSSSSLGFKKTSGGEARYYGYAYGALPPTFSTSPTVDPVHWSFYATFNSSSIAFNQVAAATPQVPTQTVAVTYPRTQKAGNLNIVVVGWNDTVSRVKSVKDSAGNVYSLAAGPISGTRLRQAIYFAKGIKGATNVVTVTFNQKAVYPDIRILEYAGVSTLNRTTGRSGYGSTSSTAAVTTTEANQLLFAANTVSSGTSEAGSSFTSRMITTPNGDIAADRIVSSTGSFAASASLTSPGYWVMQMVTFR